MQWTSAVRMLMGAMVAGLLAANPAYADYPEQSVKVVVPYPAGGFLDAVTRVFAARLAQVLGKPVVIENRPGAGGKIGEEFVASAKPDGYTLASSTITRPTLMQAVSPGTPELDMKTAMAVIGPMGSSPTLMSAALSLGVKDFGELVGKIRAEPGKHSYASAGVGTPSQLISAQITRLLKLDATHVPYRGGAPALNDLAAGVVAWMVDTPSGSLSLIQGGKIVPLFVISPNRVKQLPNVPTLQELGYPQFRDQIVTIFLMAPAGTPKPVLDRLNAALRDVQADPAIRSYLEGIGMVAPPPTDLEAARAAALQQIEAWSEAVRLAGGTTQ